MRLVKTINEVRTIRHAESNLSWGLVPTMGALHEGHLALVRQARAENERVAVSIFVNPTQFNDPADLDRYPRDLDRDADLLRQAGVDLVWTPDADVIYPPGYQTYVMVEDITQVLEGEHRPGHFRGVATVVTKLLNVVEPHRAYFGQKDAQQVAVIERMVADLAMRVQVVRVPIVREVDGLAMSSRNQHLNPEERKAARILYTALSAARTKWEANQRDADLLRRMMRDTLATEPLARIDYVSVADPDTLQELEGDAERTLLSMAAFIGKVRLIDNMLVG